MSLPIIMGVPPLFDEIDAVFHVRGQPVVFTWGHRIYNPTGVFVPPEILVHEQVHADRQTIGFKYDDETAITDWWKRYLADPEFRLAEELPAHRAEYHALVNRTRDRNVRSRYLQHVAAKLSAPLYGGIIKRQEAIRRIAA